MTSIPKQPEPESTFTRGDRVKHGKWGAGTVVLAVADRTSVTFDNGGTHVILASFLRPGPPKADNDNDLPFINPADWHGMPVPKREWFLDGLIPRRQVTILNGDGGVGKSLLALQIGAASAMGCETIGLQPMAGRVMYLGAEDEADEFHRRLADITYQHHRQLSDLTDFRLIPMADRDALLAVPDKAGVMQPTDNMGKLVERLTEFRPGFLVLDTSADLFGGDEIKRNHVRQFIAMLRKPAIQLDMAVLLLSHPSIQGMQSGTGSSGSTAWNNSVRSRLYLTKGADDEDLRILTTKKANYGKTGSEIRIRWEDGAFALDDGKPSAAVKLLDNRADKVFIKLLSEINRSGQNVSPNRSSSYAPTVMAKRPDRDGMSKKAFEEAMHRALADGSVAVITEGSPSRQRQRLVVVADEVAQGRAAGLPTVPSNGLPTPTNGGAHTPPITPGALEAHPTVGSRSVTSNANDNDEDFDPAKLTFLTRGAA